MCLVFRFSKEQIYAKKCNSIAKDKPSNKYIKKMMFTETF